MVNPTLDITPLEILFIILCGRPNLAFVPYEQDYIQYVVTDFDAHNFVSWAKNNGYQIRIARDDISCTD